MAANLIILYGVVTSRALCFILGGSAPRPLHPFTKAYPTVLKPSRYANHDVLSIVSVLAGAAAIDLATHTDGLGSTNKASAALPSCA